MALTQDCLNTWLTYFACKSSTKAVDYYNKLSIGNNCADKVLWDLQLSIAFIDVLCDFNVEEDLDCVGCLNEQDVCKIIDNLKILLKSNCNCK